MFGFGKLALTILVIVIAVIVMMAMRRNKVTARPRPNTAPGAQSGEPKQLQAEDLVRCPTCGVYHAKGAAHRCAEKV